MLKRTVPALLVITVMASCSSLKPVGYSASTASAYSAPVASSTTAKKEVKFLDDISADASNTDTKITSRNDDATGKAGATMDHSRSTSSNITGRSSVEKASALQLKYSVLLNVEVEQLANSKILEFVDEWYGTRYKMGGNSKSGIDCSAFTQNVYQSAFGVNIPRTAKEQFGFSRIVSATEMKEGDLVFFNTRGGISHVGIYLQNNKFIHASSKNGVTVSDLFDPYYIRRYLGAGRIDKPEANVSSKKGF